MKQNYLIDYLETSSPIYQNLTIEQGTILEEIEEACQTKGSNLTVNMEDLPDDPDILTRIAFWQLSWLPTELVALVTSSYTDKVAAGVTLNEISRGYAIAKRTKYEIRFEDGGALMIYRAGDCISGNAFHTVIIAPLKQSGLNDEQRQQRDDWFDYLDCVLFFGGSKLTFV